MTDSKEPGTGCKRLGIQVNLLVKSAAVSVGSGGTEGGGKGGGENSGEEVVRRLVGKKAKVNVLYLLKDQGVARLPHSGVFGVTTRIFPGRSFFLFYIE